MTAIEPVEETEQPIARQGQTDRRDQLPNPIEGHKPYWDSSDCVNCGSAPCGPHPDILVCECTEDYPCGEVRSAAAELKRLAEKFAGQSRACKNLGFTEFSEGRADGLAVAVDELLRRSAELLGEQS